MKGSPDGSLIFHPYTYPNCTPTYKWDGIQVGYMAEDNSAPELPAVESVENNGPSATAYFENGAKLRYKETHEGIVEQVFAPSDPHSVMEESFITSRPETTANVLSESLELYKDYQSAEDAGIEELKRDWESLAEWICHK